jgi:GT2 family glycosyltransferase
MKNKVNIIIPAIKLDEELLKCLGKINKISYKDFFVTIVLDYKNKNKLPKFKFRTNQLIVGKINMSEKRNLAAERFKSTFIAFLDSDAHPTKNWLKLAIKYLKQEIGDVVGGPSLPFANQNYSEKICHLSKRSIFVTGYLNFRKYKAKKRYCDWLESCNLIMRRKFFLKYGGMDVKRYTGEDKEFFERAKRKNHNIKVFYSPDLFVYHRERRFVGFLLQRSCFGMDFLNLTKFNIGPRGFQPLLPLLTFTTFLFILFSKITILSKLIILLPTILIMNLAIFFEIKKYIKSIKALFFTIITINLANIVFALGSIIGILGLRKLLVNKFYSYSRWNN